MSDLKAGIVGFLSAATYGGILGAVIDIFSAFIVGAVGALGAWLINRYMNSKYPKK